MSGAGRVPPVQVRVNSHVVDAATAPFLTPEECAAVAAACDPHGWDDDLGRTAQRAGRKKRQQAIPGGNAGELGTRIAAKVAELNDEVFGFDLRGVEEPIRAYRYDAHEAGYIGLHGDLSDRRPLRKLTCSILLSDPSMFEGGDLAFLNGPLAAARTQGTITVFPAFALHEVTQVTSGERISLVGWAIGPTFV